MTRTLLLVAISAASILALGSGARADDADDLAACLEAAPDEGGHPLQCVGTVSGPCADGLADLGYAATADCIQREADAWDALLNSEWKLLMGNLTAEEQDLARTAQRAWIVYRDADCDAVLQLAHPVRGTLWWADCMANRTAERLLALRAMVSDPGR